MNKPSEYSNVEYTQMLKDKGYIGSMIDEALYVISLLTGKVPKNLMLEALDILFGNMTMGELMNEARKAKRVARLTTTLEKSIEDMPLLINETGMESEISRWRLKHGI